MKKIVTVSEINSYIKNILSADRLLTDISVKGEVSNYKHHYSGHMYFTLKDEGGIIKCVMFKRQASTLKVIPEDGMSVIVQGYISVFEKAGQYQLYALDIAREGMGSLHAAFEKLKKELEQKGMFDRDKKKKLPFLPRTVCVVTSSTGSVIRDIINVISRRFPNIHLRLVPAAVQGPSAATEIAEAVRKINSRKFGDVIIIARGGGSLEELWAFNERVVAESIYDSQIPVVSAVGHETDFTISDFVADVRAPTPSAAAELVVPEKHALYDRLHKMRTRMTNAGLKCVREKRAGLERLRYSSVFRQPYNMVYQQRMNIDYLVKALVGTEKTILEREKGRLSGVAGRLDALNPLKTIARGYGAVTRSEGGKFIKSVNEVDTGAEVDVTLADGTMGCTVNRIQKEK